MFSPKTPISLNFKPLAQKSLQDLHDSGASPPFQPSRYPKMPDISIAAESIDKLLVGLNPHKAIVLQTLHKELASILQLIFQRSLDTGKLPDIWKDANASPIFKKRENLTLQTTARPISLTCVLCKVLEHIVASSVAKHFTELDILYDLQHGFREKRSCETQLIMLVDELAKIMQMIKQTDLILIDFSKAFDKVAHEKILPKLHQYGIRGDTLNWIKDFLDNRKQTVVINGINSDEVPVISSVLQGSVLGPIFFLAYINDLPEQVKSRVRLFANDIAMYIAISSTTEGQVLQTDMACLEQWENMWDMQFNPSKCQVIHITRKVKPLNTKYILHNVELESASAAKYLEVTIADDLSWSPHIDNTTKKAIKPLAFLKETYESIIRTRNQLLTKRLSDHSWSMLQLYGTPTTTKT